MKNMVDFTPVKSGMAALVGAPNAGKSTLMNQLLGQKISIVTPKPQTTRNKILGVVNGDDYQIVLIDTPGLHQAREPLNREMVRLALTSLAEAEVVLFLIDASLPAPEKRQIEEEFGQWAEQVRSPAMLVLNKIDLLNKNDLLPLIDKYARLYPFKAILPVSALKGDGTAALIREILAVFPMGPRYFPDDIPTDVSERFLAAEIVREKVFFQTGQEIPYSTAVIIESFKEEAKRVVIHAAIVLERNSQKGIVIGKGGAKLKSIGIAARKDLEKLLGVRVNLKLWVKVKKNWSKNESFIKNELGF